MAYYAHKEGDSLQTVSEHLKGVAELAEGFSIGSMKKMAYGVGEFHDLGKYTSVFQRRLFGETNERYEHSVCGAIELGKIAKGRVELSLLPMLQYCIAGHHTGLPDGGTGVDSATEANTLHAKLARADTYTGDSDYSGYKNEIELSFPDGQELYNELSRSANQYEMIEKYAFFTRYLFSCLTDADFLDTEKFCNPESDRSLKADFSAAIREVEKKYSGFIYDNKLRKARKRLQEQACQNSKKAGNISILNMPTGSGKTLCSLKIALDRLKTSGKKRIIYVIPYTSIIEQTADLFEGMFGEYVDILQHHSNYCYDSDEREENSTAEKLKKSAENWDAPLIITTSVQFFESLYHYKGSKLRKLHNLADSVIIFDEVHLLPEKLLQPCLRAVGYITKYLNSEAVFLSATMPDYSELFKKYIPDCSVTELITDKKDFSFFRKCSYTYLGSADSDSVIERAIGCKSSLIVVNKRKTAREIYKNLSGNRFHLSTYMTPHDRSEVIGEIRRLLDDEQPVTVVSTSLIEAGVDLDFEAVFRELAGLDSILQAGGRCNREGKRDSGEVFVFETDEPIQKELEARASIVKDFLRNGVDIASEEAVELYYKRLFNFKEKEIESNSIANEDVNGLDQIPFRQYAKEFKLVEADTISVVINNCEETEMLLQQLAAGKLSVKRKLQRFSVSLRTHGEFDKALSAGLLREAAFGVFLLSDNAYYSRETGLDLDMSNDIICC
ncbi:MAG: CRISPR-associated helicase Cas3' [Ruminiclostridium sp.]